MSTPDTPAAPVLEDAARVSVTSMRYNGTIHDFVMLNALRDTQAARAATVQGGEFLRATQWDE